MSFIEAPAIISEIDQQIRMEEAILMSEAGATLDEIIAHLKRSPEEAQEFFEKTVKK